jgi:hypothetical protein
VHSKQRKIGKERKKVRIEELGREDEGPNQEEPELIEIEEVHMPKVNIFSVDSYQAEQPVAITNPILNK